jgi:hypothetical protein
MYALQEELRMGKRLVSSVSEHRFGMDAHVSSIKYAQLNLSPLKPRAKCKEKSGMDKMKERRGGGKKT